MTLTVWQSTDQEFSRMSLSVDLSGVFIMIVVVQLLSHVRLFVTLWTAAHQASLSITDSRNLLKLMSTKSLMPSNHPIPCCPLLHHH